MYNVLLVDDEDSVLNNLRTSIDWQSLGIDSLLIARDGLDALDIFEKQQIDLLITDIRMPRMDGLELIQTVRDLYPNTHYILLTAYGEFDYARQAIRLGVENYLLKPVAKEEFEQTVSNALNNLYHQQHNKSEFLLENILRRWTLGKINSEELSERASILGINLYLPQYCVISIIKHSNSSISVFRSSLLNMLQRTLDIWHFWDEKGRFIIILGGKELDLDNIRNQLNDLILQENVINDVTISLGPLVTETDLLHLSYMMASENIEQTDLSNSQTVLPNRQDNDSDLMIEEIRTLFFDNSPEFRSNGYRHFALKLYKAGAVQSQYNLMQACVSMMVAEFPEEINLQQRIFEQVRDILPNIEKSAFIDTVHDLLSNIYNIFNTCMNKRSPIVQSALFYIHNVVLSGGGISIKEFCVKNGMNPAYIGYLFKQETGVFFNDYLAQCRINHSVILLQNPNLKIKDIAERIGFASTSYYVKCFRESKGISPAKYRLNLEQKYLTKTSS